METFLLLLLVLLCFSNAASGGFVHSKQVNYTPEAVRDKVTDRLPGLSSSEDVQFDQYAGYVTVNQTAGRALFYWLTEAYEDASSKPLVLWLNGGPGCSSVGYGAMQEIGPFHLNNSTVVLNPYSWNRVANILFLESPAGVGFSYSNTSTDLQTPGDENTARDSLVFLQRWLERFPVYKDRDFFLTGESYAGNYVPQLAKLIYVSNKDGSSESIINLKGFMVGNAVMDYEQDFLGRTDYWFTHALISHQTHASLIRSCDFRGHVNGSRDECLALVRYAFEHEFGSIDRYNIYAEICLSDNFKPLVFCDQARCSEEYHVSKQVLRSTKFPGYDPCIEDYVQTYLNKPEVQRVLHANVSGNILYPWSPCSRTISENWQDRMYTALPIYKELIQAGLRIWVYSGDVDAVVPVTSSRYSIEKLNLTIATTWFPWYGKDQVGGYSEVYEGLTFVTIRGAGHEVPMFQPGRALSLIESFLAGREMPKQPNVNTL